MIYPFFKENPYQYIINTELEKMGYEIVAEPPHYTRFQFHIIKKLHEYDILHLHWIGFCYSANYRIWFIIKTIVLCFMIAFLRIRGKKIILTLHNLIPHDSKYIRLHVIARKYIIKTVNKVIVHSDPALKKATRLYKSCNKFIVIPHVNYKDFYSNSILYKEARDKLGLEMSKKVLLFFGTIKPYKNIEILLRFMKDLKNENYILILCGTGELDYIQSLNNDIYENVKTYFKYIPDDEIQLFMNAADCLLLPYSHSFTSAAAVLGIGFCLPIVCKSHVAFEHLVRRDLCYEFDYDNINSFEEAIYKAINCNRTDFTDKCNVFLEECSPIVIASKHSYLYD